MGDNRSDESSRTHFRATIWSALIGSIGLIGAAWIGVSLGRDQGEDRLAELRKELQQRDSQIAELRKEVDDLRIRGEGRPGSAPAESTSSGLQTNTGSGAPSNSNSSGSPEIKASGDGEQVEVVEGLNFVLRKCVLIGDEVDCDLSVTPNQDKLLTFWGSSRLVENDGNELLASKISLGSEESRRGRYSSIQKDLVRGVPMKLGVAFAGVKPNSESVNLIELVCSGLRVQFRNVALQNDA